MFKYGGDDLDLSKDIIKGSNHLKSFKQQHTGHTTEDAERLKTSGKYNVLDKPPSRTISEIIFANIFTIFNATLITLAVIMIGFRFYKESLFVVPVIINILTGIAQELRTKNKIENAGIVNVADVLVVRDGVEMRITPENIVLDDLLILKQGQQIPVDLISIDERNIDIDESLLTGEIDPVAKGYASIIYAGSFVLSGSIFAQAFRVGHDTYISKLSDEARKYKIVHSELRESTNRIMKVIAICIVILTPFVFMAYLSQYDIRTAVYIITPVIAGMVPEGLILLTTVTLMLGVIDLMEKNTLVQEMAAVETLARVDVLCLDKTGTITEGTFDVNDFIFFDDEGKKTSKALIELITNDPDKNATANAIMNEITKENLKLFHTEVEFDTSWEVDKIYPFNSSRKWSGIKFQNGESWIIGAPDFIFPENINVDFPEIKALSQSGFRVIGIAKVEISSENILTNVMPKGIVTLSDRIREEALETFKYFKEQGVELKVISGDNPQTVQSVAIRAGLGENIKAIDATMLPSSIEDLAELMDAFTIFGRVTPHQKKLMIQALQFNGHTVGMTGDGVNDILALKESDCAIAMNSGSEASKAVSQFVLLDSNFATLPTAVAAGRRSINNIQSVASIFLVKNIYSILFTIITICVYLYTKFVVGEASVLGYPFDPMYFALISSVSIGYPATMLALLPNNNRVEGTFLQNIIKVSIPTSIMIVVGIVIFWILQANNIMFIESNKAEVITDNPGLMQFQFVAMMFTVWMQFYAVVRSSLPFTWKKLIIICINILIFVSAFYIPFVSDFLNISRALPYAQPIHFIIPIGFAIIGMFIAYIFEKVIDKFMYKN